MRIVVALGGNALLHRGEQPEASTQTRRVAEVAPALARLAAAHELVLVHGNGPQVGLLAAENVTDATISTAYPLGDMVAESQGLIGLWLQQALHNAGAAKPSVTVVSQTVVAETDPAWQHPTKFIGPAYSAADSDEATRKYGWSFARDGQSSRRVVASPEPLEVIEIDIIDRLLGAGITVIAGGGGGVPVKRGPDGLIGVDAVVDKDSVAALLATSLHADLLVILTDVSAVMADFGSPGQHPIASITPDSVDIRRFAAGSMGPKVRAAIGFVHSTGRRAAIGSLDDAEAVISGKAGTQVVVDSGPRAGSGQEGP